MKHGSLFSGIGGFDLAAEWMGWENVFHCEWNPFGQKVLKYYWPKAESFDDITKTDFKKYANKIDILTGGFPCQPYSQAGKRKGKEDERHLWPEMLRAIREIQPRWIVGENVFGLVNWSRGLVFHEVQTDLENSGYEVFPYLLNAASVGAPHKRDRIWFVAHTTSQGREEREQVRGWKNATENKTRLDIWSKRFRSNGDIADTDNTGLERIKEFRNAEHIRKKSQKQPTGRIQSTWQKFPTQSPVCNGDDGISAGLDGITFSKWRNESIKAGGNAIVPNVVFQIFKTIKEYEDLNFKGTGNLYPAIL
jgi:DNA (cytosine-5)-methyltransferase 1